MNFILFLFFCTLIVSVFNGIKVQNREAAIGLFTKVKSRKVSFAELKHGIFMLYVQPNAIFWSWTLSITVFYFGFDSRNKFFGSRKNGVICSWDYFELDVTDVAELNIAFIGSYLVFLKPFSPGWTPWHLVFSILGLCMGMLLINSFDTNKFARFENFIYASSSLVVVLGIAMSDINYTGLGTYSVNVLSFPSWILAVPFVAAIALHLIVRPLNNYMLERYRTKKPLYGYKMAYVIFVEAIPEYTIRALSRLNYILDDLKKVRLFAEETETAEFVAVASSDDDESSDEYEQTVEDNADEILGEEAYA